MEPTPLVQPAFTRTPGVTYAQTQGMQVPVIDVTHPAFEVADDARTVESLRSAAADLARRSRRAPRFLMRWLLRSAVKRSFLARALMQPGQSVLPGMSTYMMKLGAGNLVPPFNGRTDRRFAASPGIMSMRIRLQQTARLLAEGLATTLVQHPGAALHLINIGGGSAIDSLNVLILLRRSGALMQRRVVIHLLDPDTSGPAFAARALAALSAAGGPLAGLAASLVHTSYNWEQTQPLERLVADLMAEGAVIAASSEGALFEYGSDEFVVANLKALSAGGAGAVLVAGTVTRADDMTRQTLAYSPFKLVPRGEARFAELIAGSGYSLERAEHSLISDQVLLRRA